MVFFECFSIKSDTSAGWAVAIKALWLEYSTIKGIDSVLHSVCLRSFQLTVQLEGLLLLICALNMDLFSWKKAWWGH